MDPALNPYSPGSGRRPPHLVGRASELEAFDTLVARSRRRLDGRGIVLTGLRGVGKTVLLNEMHTHAARQGWFVVRMEARPDPLGEAAVRRRLARDMVVAARKHSRGRLSASMKRALGTISGFNAKVGATGIDLGVKVTPGRADSGDSEVDLAELVEDLTTALREQNGTFGLFIDEMQDLDPTSMGALIAAQHAAGQQDWPFYIIGAGLPHLPRTLTESRSYAERLFDYRRIGRLNDDDAAAALVDPATRYGASYSDQALEVLLDAAGGYPYFLQEFGQATWNLAPEKVFTKADAHSAVTYGREQLDNAFYLAPWERATPAERRFLRAMADDANHPSATGDIGSRLDIKVSSLGPYRAKLIAKGLVYAPQHGQLAYTVPGMAEFVIRHHDEADQH